MKYKSMFVAIIIVFLCEIFLCNWKYWTSSDTNESSPEFVLENGEIIECGKRYVLGDSYENTMLPFLSLATKDIKVAVPRNLDISVHDVVESGNYDTVIMAYAQFMVGAHDDEYNANYKMFTLE